MSESCTNREDDGVGAARSAARSAARILLAVAALTIAAFACWRYLPGVFAWLADPAAVRAFVAEHALVSRVALVGINVLQIILAFLPGEPVELASGYAFGLVEGTVLCLVACALGTSVVFWAVRRWGEPLVGRFFDRTLCDRFAWLRDERRLGLVMLVAFLIPGTPKDFLTYFAGLTRMRFSQVIAIATVGRIPSIVTSTAVASAAGDGDLATAAVCVAVAALLLLAGTFAWRRISAAHAEG